MAQESHRDFLITLARNDDKPRQGTLFDFLFGIAVWLTCTFSTWATYIGFSVDFPKPIAAVIALAIGLFLVGLNFELRKRRRAAESLLGPLTMLAVVVVFSFIGNTNAIYSYSIQRDIVGQTQEQAWRVFDSETSKILAAIAEVSRLVIRSRVAEADSGAELEVVGGAVRPPVPVGCPVGTTIESVARELGAKF